MRPYLYICISIHGLCMAQQAGKKDTYDDVEQSLAFYIERYVLDDDGGGYDLVVPLLSGSGREGGRHLLQRGRTASRREI